MYVIIYIIEVVDMRIGLLIIRNKARLEKLISMATDYRKILLQNKKIDMLVLAKLKEITKKENEHIIKK